MSMFASSDCGSGATGKRAPFQRAWLRPRDKARSGGEDIVFAHADIVAVRPPAGGARTDALGQDDPAHRARRDILRVDQHAFGLVGFEVGDEGDEIAIILVLRIDPRCEGRLAAETAGTEFILLARPRLKVVFDQPAKQEPARLGDRAIGVAIALAGIASNMNSVP